VRRAWDTLGITRNPAAIVRLPAPRTRKRRCWSVDEAGQFLESTRHDQEALSAAFVLILVLGLRKGEVLGLTWELVDLDVAKLYVGEQVQRVGNEHLRRQVLFDREEYDPERRTWRALAPGNPGRDNR
jgi:integrase